MNESAQANDPPEDPITFFLEDITYQGKSPRTREAYQRVLREFEAYLCSRNLTLPDANHRDCMAYIHKIRVEVAASTVATYASYLHRFYDYMQRVGVFDDNPMSLVLEEIDESITTDPRRRDISIEEMRSFVASISHPLDRAIVITFLKTGIRVGELCNLDERDVYIDHDIAGEADLCDTTHRPALDGHPNSLFVDDSPAAGSEYNDEHREASNKRKRSTTIPIDDELATALGRWLAIRPDPVSPARPLFCSTGKQWGQRLGTDTVYQIVVGHAERAGWHREGGGPEENVTPHYFRHFFTTHLRDRTGDRGIVKYLRGDVASDIIDTYTHNWGSMVRAVYLDSIYQIT